jgi:hypothetical protein
VVVGAVVVVVLVDVDVGVTRVVGTTAGRVVGEAGTAPPAAPVVVVVCDARR